MSNGHAYPLCQARLAQWQEASHNVGSNATGGQVGAYVVKQHLAGRKRYPLVLMLEPLFRCNLPVPVAARSIIRPRS